MKPKYLLYQLSFLLLLISISGFAQDINVHKYIGKTRSDVIKNYGNPVHQDNSNPAMICMFYKRGNDNMIFVSDKDGIYQAEANISFDKETEARTALNILISGSVTDGFKVDSVTISDFHLEKTGVKVGLQLSENKLVNKFDIRVKANRTSN